MYELINVPGIYKITNKINGKVYVGSSITLKARHDTHFHDMKKEIHFNKHLRAAAKKYGIENFEFSILELVPLEDDKEVLKRVLLSKEEIWIKKLNAGDPEFGYNRYIIPNSPLGITRTEEEKRNISTAKKGKGMGEDNPFYGKKHSEETRKKMSLSHSGAVVSEETKRKMSESHKGHVWTEESKSKVSRTKKGIPKSEETRRKMSEAKKGVGLEQMSEKRKASFLAMQEKNKGRKNTPETLKRMSESRKKYYSTHSVSDETKERMRLLNKGKKLSDEVKRKMSEAHKSLETKDKMRASLKAKIDSGTLSDKQIDRLNNLLGESYVATEDAKD
jgi:group I intron endonuclease